MEDLRRTTMKLKESLTLVSVEDSGALLDADKRCYYDLNHTAFFLLRFMEEGCHYESLQTELVSEFNIDEETARCDIDTFVGKLINLDSIQIKKIASESPPISKTKKGNIRYETPTIEYTSELAVACAATVG